MVDIGEIFGGKRNERFSFNPLPERSITSRLWKGAGTPSFWWTNPCGCVCVRSEVTGHSVVVKVGSIGEMNKKKQTHTYTHSCSCVCYSKHLRKKPGRIRNEARERYLEGGYGHGEVDFVKRDAPRPRTGAQDELQPAQLPLGGRHCF